MAKKTTDTDAAKPEVEKLSDVPDAEIVTDEPIAPEQESRSPEADVTPEPAPRRNGALSLAFGGAVAAAMGFGAAFLWLPKVDSSALAAQTQQISALIQKVEALAAVQSAIDVEGAVASGNAEALARVDGLKRDFEAATLDINARIDSIERAPSADGSLTEAALAAYERDIAALRAEVVAQQERLQEIADAAAAQLEQTRSEAAKIEQSAADTARDAVARAALARVRAALESGVPFAADLPDLAAALDGEVPEALSQVANGGISSLASLQEEFPDLARAALAAARQEGVSGESSGGLTALIRSQFDVRSVEPRDGTDADAVLSRAEDALRTGRLNDCLAEIATLPDVARETLAPWTAKAEARTAAQAAVETLLLNQN